MKALIFGINGQDGFYLNSLLAKNKIEVLGISRSNENWIIGDVSNGEFVENLIKSTKPDFIFHLAANSTTSHDSIFENHETIATGTLNILESVKKYSFHSKVFLSGSALQFCNGGNPIDESALLVATSPYVVSRNQSLYAARYYRSLGLNVYFGFLFNHDSPLRPGRHMAQKIALYCKEVANKKEKLKIGAIEVRKEWTYAGDLVEAIWTLVNQEKIFECIIGSGKAYSILEWLEVCFSLINRNWRDYVEIAEGFTPEYNVLVSNPKKIFSLGWEPKVSFQDLAKMMIK